jgi:glycosyltransferase involved in cell wall biosynthesis
MGMYRPIVRSLRKERVFHLLAGRALVAGAARIIATSEQELHELRDEGIPAAKCVVRRNGLDLAAFASLPARGAFRRELGVGDDAFLLLYLGRLSRKKGLDLLVRALAGLPPRVELAIVGPDDHDGSLDEVKRLASAPGLGERVHFCPPRYERAKLEALVDAHLFVLLSQNENFGNSVVESLACGVPALVTDCCGVATHIQGRAAIVVAYDEQAIRGGVEAALSDPHLVGRLRGQAASVVAELSWAEPMREMVEIYMLPLTSAVDGGSQSALRDSGEAA